MRPPVAPIDLARVAVRSAGIGAADLISQAMRIFVVYEPIGGEDALQLMLEIARNGLPLYLGIALALELDDARWLPWSPPARRIAVGAGALLAVVASVLLISISTGSRLGLTASTHAVQLHNSWNNSIVAIVSVLYLTRRRESREAEAHRAATALRLEQARRHLGEVSTRTAQSRAEPQMVFDCLARSRDVYPVDTGRGDALLDRLTHYLRLTLGIASKAETTLAHEAGLAAARIDVERAETDLPMALEIDPLAAAAPFPADLLAPLAHVWLRHPEAAAPRGLRVTARQVAGALRLRLEGPCRVPEPALRRAAANLQAHAGDRGRLRADAHGLSLEIDHA